MAINYADKYSAKIDERFKTGALTAPAINNDYDFTGVQTVKVYSIPTAGMNDYTPTGANRYGTPAELEDSVQEMTLTKDRSFTFTIDRSNYQDTGMLKEAGAALQRQIDEVIIPELECLVPTLLPAVIMRCPSPTAARLSISARHRMWLSPAQVCCSTSL